jgi:hypothetical protein
MAERSVNPTPQGMKDAITWASGHLATLPPAVVDKAVHATELLAQTAKIRTREGDTFRLGIRLSAGILTIAVSSPAHPREAEGGEWAELSALIVGSDVKTTDAERTAVVQFRTGDLP